MFGGRRNRGDDDAKSLSKAMQPADAPSSSSSKQGSGFGNFDPEGFERAAKAMRELDQSRNASAAIELIKTQEITKQHENAAKRAEMEAYMEQQRAQNIASEAEEARRTLDAQTQHAKKQAEYSDQLERKRQVDMLNAQKYMQEEQLKKQEEMAARQEEMRRKTAAYEAELRTKTELAKTKAEAEGRILQERQNHDLILEKVRLEAAEQRDTVLKALQDGGKLVGDGVSHYLNNPSQLRNTVLTLTGLAVGVYTARTGIGIAGRYVEARLGKPSLVRETSRTSYLGNLFSLSGLYKALFAGNKSSTNALAEMVLEPQLDKQLRQIAVSTTNTKRNQAPFRHLLLHGPPGTGKTMFARGLAHHSGLDYAIFTGGDVAPLGRDAVTELHKLFDWAETSRSSSARKGGLLLFVDEADAFLQSRETNRLSEDQRNALNAFLYRTGTQSDKFMVVYASNQPAQFDPAVLDRVDEMVEFPLPGPDERRRMIAMYMDKYLFRTDTKKGFFPWSQSAKPIQTVDIGEAEIDEVVKQTEGFSGRALSKLAIAWQAAAYGTEGAVLDRETFFETVAAHKRSMDTKDDWMVHAKQRAQLLATDG